MAKSKQELVVKDNKLIEASYRLDLVEQRIILFGITEARKTQKGLSADTFAIIRAKDYAEVYGVAPNKAYEHIKEAARTLFLREFTLYGVWSETGDKDVITSRWLSATSHVDGAGVVRLAFSPIVVLYIIRLEAAFTRYKLEQIAGMTSVYAIRLYELLIQWGSVGERDIDVEWLRRALMLDGQYKDIKNFKVRVIDVAVAQINLHSDLIVSYTQKKTGRTVSSLIFKFDQKPDVKVAQEAHKEEAKAAKAREKRDKEEIARVKARDDEEAERLRRRDDGDTLFASYLKLPESDRQEILATVLANVPGLRAIYERRGLDHSAVKAAICIEMRR